MLGDVSSAPHSVESRSSVVAGHFGPLAEVRPNAPRVDDQDGVWGALGGDAPPDPTGGGTEVHSARGRGEAATVCPETRAARGGSEGWSSGGCEGVFVTESSALARRRDCLAVNV